MEVRIINHGVKRLGSNYSHFLVNNMLSYSITKQIDNFKHMYFCLWFYTYWCL